LRRAALGVAALAACLLAPAAQPHFGTAKLGYKSTIEGVQPRIPGARFKILYGDDQVWLDNRSGKTIVIDGYGGEPYLRFTPAGIFVNANSPAGFLNQDRYGKSKVPKFASENAPPRWQKLAGGDVWAWHDHRIHYMSAAFPPVIRNAPDQPHHVFDWKVPATANGKRFFIDGSLDYTPPPPPEQDNSFPFALVIALAVVVGAGLVGLFFLRRVLVRSLE
jgi:hypothetical protein